MSRGLGRIERRCLEVIATREAEKPEYVRLGDVVVPLCDQRPTTYTVVADVYDITADEHGCRLFTEAQHVAVKRALNSLCRKGLVTKLRDLTRGKSVFDGRPERCCRWSLAETPF